MSLRALFSASILVSFGILAGRLMGLLREMVLAASFGTGAQADSVVALMVIPDTIIGTLMGNAGAAMLIPLFTRRKPEDAVALFWQVLLLAMVFFALLALLVGSNDAWILPHALRGVLPPAQTSRLFLTTLVALPLTAMTLVVASYLQYRGRFLAPAFSAALFNGCLCVGLWWFPGQLTMVAPIILAAAGVRFLVHMLALRGGASLWVPGLWRQWRLDGGMFQTYAKAVAIDLLFLLPQVIPYYLLAESGALALFNYAFRLALVPAMIGYNVVLMVFLPWFSKLAVSKEHDGNDAHHALTLRAAWVLSLAVCFSVRLAASALVSLCFRASKIPPEDLVAMAQLLKVGVWAMPGIVLTGLWQQKLYADGNYRLPLQAVAWQALLAFPFFWLGREYGGVNGVMLAYVFVPLAALGWMMGRSRAVTLRADVALMTLAMVGVGGAFQALLPISSTFKSLLLAMMAAAVILAVGLCACKDLRHWVSARIKRVL